MHKANGATAAGERIYKIQEAAAYLLSPSKPKLFLRFSTRPENRFFVSLSALKASLISRAGVFGSYSFSCCNNNRLLDYY